MNKIEKIEFLDKEKIEKEFEKVCKQVKDFKNDFAAWQKNILKTDDVNLIVRPRKNVFEKIANTKCAKKIFWKAYLKDANRNYENMTRIIFFVKQKNLYVIEIYHHKYQKNCDYKLFKKYCDC